jgi:S-adenosylmethionine synthetase
MDITLHAELTADPRKGAFELVERKGVGHPDTMCDAISETMSRYYSQFCLLNFGRVAHHWFDKVMLIGGEADIRFGVGRITRPYKLIFAGKCALRVGDVPIPLMELAKRAACDVLARTLTGFDADKHLVTSLEVVDSTGPGRSSARYRPQSNDELPSLDSDDLISNDANILVAYSTPTPLEDLVLFTESLLNGVEYKRLNPDVGWDIKVIGRRAGANLSVLVNVPFLARHITSTHAYNERKQCVTRDLRERLRQRFDVVPELTVNPADVGGAHPYLLALGSAADTGDVGATGRGNRSNGLITPMRPMSIEAPAGKNPVDHTGKLHTLAARDLAQTIATTLNASVEVFIYTAKGSPARQPDHVMINVSRALDIEEQAGVRHAVAAELARMGELSLRVIETGVAMW